ncbi:MAG: hypothetical protein RI956_499, partial [Pseudomonadota bacterium]
GGAMDLVAGVKRVVVLMEHTAKGNVHKLLPKCTLPLTGVAVVDLIITNYGVIEITKTGLSVLELAHDITPEYMQAATGVALTFKC